MTRERGRMHVDALPVLVPAVAAQTSDQVAPPAHEENQGEPGHDRERLDASSPRATANTGRNHFVLCTAIIEHLFHR